MGSGLGRTGETAGRWTEYDKLVNSGERAAAEVCFTGSGHRREGYTIETADKYLLNYVSRPLAIR